MEKAAVLIDGGYLDALNLNHFGKRRIDFLQFSEELCNPSNSYRFRTYWYNAPPWQDNPPTPKQSRQLAGYQKFTSSLERKPRFTVRAGVCKMNVTTSRPEQKGVDVLLACDLVRLAARNVITRAIIIGGDADFVPAVGIAKEELIITELIYYPGSCSPALWDACDERIRLTQAFINSVSTP